MVFDSECMLTDPVSMLERCERQKNEALVERRQNIERYRSATASSCFGAATKVQG